MRSVQKYPLVMNWVKDVVADPTEIFGLSDLWSDQVSGLDCCRGRERKARN
jgi:hypothetical protein